MTKLEEDNVEIITRLEREMFEAAGFNIGALVSQDEIKTIKAAAEVAKRYIDNLANFLIDNSTGSGKIAGILRQQCKNQYQNWLKENGIIE